MKIKLINSDRYSVLYNFDDKEIKLTFLKSKINNKTDFNALINDFYQLENYLKNYEYFRNNGLLVQLLLKFNLKNLMIILTNAFYSRFIEMFRYYTVIYVNYVYKYDSNNCFCSTILREIFKDESNYIYSYNEAYLNGMIKDIIGYESEKIIEDEVDNLWILEIKKCFANNENLYNVYRKIGNLKMLQICYKHLYKETAEYLRYIARQFTKGRDTITFNKLANTFLGYEIAKSSIYSDYPMVPEIKQIANEEYAKQYSNFVNDNYKEINSDKDIWKLYWYNGPSLNSKNYNFMLIKSLTLRKEVKLYMKNRLSGFYNTNDVFIETIYFALNYITDNNKEVRFFADITDTDVTNLLSYLENDYITQFGKVLSVSSIKKAIKNCGLVVDFFIKNYSNNSKIPTPNFNYFSRIKFKNLKKYHKPTDIIPENVLDEINQHIGELEKRHQTMFNIYINSGLRMKEVVYLEDSCLKPSRYDGLFLIKYIPYKVLISRRKKNLHDYQEILITEELANIINEQKDMTKDLRKEYNTNLMFINQKEGFRAYVTQGKGFLAALNRLVKKYSIKDESGEMFKFTSRQFRKTIAVKLIEDGATTDEVAYLLGHLSKKTTKEYYEEVRKMELAKMNTKFFRDKFDVIISEQNLEVFTEEQRKLLYIDFRLENRRIELGFCSRHFKDGPCNRKERQYNCVNCEKLCTGQKYLSYWIKLKNEQSKIIEDLLNFYKEHNMKNYESYLEFQQEHYLLKCYDEIVGKIQSSC